MRERVFGSSFLEKQEVSDDFIFRSKEVNREGLQDGGGMRGMKRFQEERKRDAYRPSGQGDQGT